MTADKIKELASDNVLMSAYLPLEEIKQLRALLALELQAVRDDRRAQHKEFQQLTNELWETLRKIQAQFRIEAQLLNLIRPQDTGKNDEHIGNQGNGTIKLRFVTER